MGRILSYETILSALILHMVAINMSESPYIANATDETFSSLVLEKSHETPVMVDFWADWCQPCKSLMPVLMKLAEEYQGAFNLVKVNTDEYSQLATEYGIRSLPTVKIFKNGEMIDEFMGVQTEPVIREMIEKRRVREGAEKRKQALELFQSGDEAGAEVILSEVVAEDPEYYEAVLELINIQLGVGKSDEAEDLLQSLPADIHEHEQTKALVAKVKIIKMRDQAGDVDTLKQQLEANPEDFETMLLLANSEIANENYEQGMALFFNIMKKDDSYQDHAGRKGLLSAFELLEVGNPLIKKYRSKMFSLMH